MNVTDQAASRRDKAGQVEVGRQLSRIVTTSWDDGDLSDLKIAEMLQARNLPGTFYVPISGHHGSFGLGRSELRILESEGFEIGGHGLSHLVLSQCGSKEVAHEVVTCKRRLEDILGSEVRMFAYPRGRYSSVAIRSVKVAGYAGARTTQMLAYGLEFDPYKMPTTIHVYPHSKWDYVRNTARAVEILSAWTYITQLRQVDSWVDLAKLLFDSTLREGGIFHLYGHSWEIEELGLWDSLEEILDYVSNRDGVLYLPNGDSLDYLISKNHSRPAKHCRPNHESSPCS